MFYVPRQVEGSNADYDQFVMSLAFKEQCYFPCVFTQAGLSTCQGIWPISPMCGRIMACKNRCVVVGNGLLTSTCCFLEASSGDSLYLKRFLFKKLAPSSFYYMFSLFPPSRQFSLCCCSRKF